MTAKNLDADVKAIIGGERLFCPECGILLHTKYDPKEKLIIVQHIRGGSSIPCSHDNRVWAYYPLRRELYIYDTDRHRFASSNRRDDPNWRDKLQRKQPEQAYVEA